MQAAEKMCPNELSSLEECKDESLGNEFSVTILKYGHHLLFLYCATAGHKLSCLLENVDDVGLGKLFCLIKLLLLQKINIYLLWFLQVNVKHF